MYFFLADVGRSKQWGKQQTHLYYGNLKEGKKSSTEHTSATVVELYISTHFLLFVHIYNFALSPHTRSRRFPYR